MSIKIVHGIEHPTKGLLGFDKGQPTYPNEADPENVDLDNTSLFDKDAQDERLGTSTLLQEEGCKVVGVEVSCAIIR